MDFSSQFIFEIYLHRLIEWFALTNLITKIWSKSKAIVSTFFLSGKSHW